MHIGTDFGVGIGRRDGFGAMTGREAISAQDNCFLGVAIGVAGGVSGSESFEAAFGWLIGGVSTNAGSLGGGGVAGADTAIDVGIAGSLGVGSAGFAFGVEGGVGIAFGVRSAITQGQVGE